MFGAREPRPLACVGECDHDQGSRSGGLSIIAAPKPPLLPSRFQRDIGMEKPMNEASRRDVLRTVLPAGAATAAVRLVIVPDTAEAVVVVGLCRPIVGGPHRLRRRWVCWSVIGTGFSDILEGPSPS
jgi:hypothetical protein